MLGCVEELTGADVAVKHEVTIMAMYPIELLEQLDGARMVVTEECKICETIAISIWHGGASVNYTVTNRGEFMSDGLWTSYELEMMPVWEVERMLRKTLMIDLCSCLAKDLEVV